MRFSPEVLSISAIFIACAVSIGFIFSTIPNLELMTATVFLGGYILGRTCGLFIGFFSALLWSSLNPWGSGLAYPTILAAQSIGFSAAGFSGGIIRLIVNPTNLGLKSLVILGLSGFVLTAFYDTVTNLGSILFSGFELRMIRNILIAGIPLSFFHIGINTLLFFTVLPSLIKALNKTGFLEKYFRKNNSIK